MKQFGFYFHVRVYPINFPVGNRTACQLLYGKPERLYMSNSFWEIGAPAVRFLVGNRSACQLPYGKPEPLSASFWETGAPVNFLLGNRSACQLPCGKPERLSASLWETGVPVNFLLGNRSARKKSTTIVGRVLINSFHRSGAWVRVTFKTFSLRIEPVKGERSDHCAPEATSIVCLCWKHIW